MKKTIIALVLIASGVVACTPKTSKTPLPANTVTLEGNIESGGLIISSSKCTKCHGNKTNHVSKHTFEEQEKLMQTMANKAKLNPQETADLMAYVKTNAKK